MWEIEFAAVDVIANFSLFLFVFASTFTDIFKLRLVTMAAITLESFYLIVAPEHPLWIYVGWNVAFLAINGFHVLKIFHHRYNLKMTEEESELFHGVFKAFPEYDFQLLIRAGQWRELEAGAELTRQGETVERIEFIYQGMVHIKVDDKVVGTLHNGQFVGEMSFVTGDPASATAMTSMPTKVVGWSQPALKKLLEDNPGMRQPIERVFNMDLLKKLSSTGVVRSI